MIEFVFHYTSPITIVLTAVVVLITAVYISTTVHRLLQLGPGPWGIPFLGFYPFIRKDFHVHLKELGQKYGDAYLLSLCGRLFLNIGSHKAMREIFITKGDCFQGRSLDFSILQYLFEDGLTFSTGEPWKPLRKFLTQSTRELGLGPKEQLKGPLLDSLQTTLNSLRESTHKGEPVDIGDLLTYECTVVIRRLVLGNNISKETVLKLNELFLESNLLTGELAFLLVGKIARYLILPWNKAFKRIIEVKSEIDALYYEILNKHKANFDSQQPEDFIDLYLRERKIREEKGDLQAKYFTDKALVATVAQVYGDGGFTVGAFLTYYLKELAARVDVQNAIYEEIAREIGTGRLPTYEDRIKLPFTNSVLKEIERMSVFLPVFPSLECCRDTTISGVFVPKGTITLVNAYAIHNNQSVYENPNHFNPERYMLDEETKRPKAELPVTFGIGKRSCAGESLVMTNIFIYVTAIMQHFTLHLVKPEKLNDQTERASDFVDVLDYKFKAVPRADCNVDPI